MVEGERHRIDTREILVVEKMLLARHAAALAMKVGAECPNDRIKNGNRRYLQAATSLLQQLTKGVVDEGEQNQTRVGLNPGNHPIDLAARSNHAPDMLDGMRVVELHKTGPCDRMNRLSGGIGN